MVWSTSLCPLFCSFPVYCYRRVIFTNWDTLGLQDDETNPFYWYFGAFSRKSKFQRRLSASSSSSAIHGQRHFQRNRTRRRSCFGIVLRDFANRNKEDNSLDRGWREEVTEGQEQLLLLLFSESSSSFASVRDFLLSRSIYSIRVRNAVLPSWPEAVVEEVASRWWYGGMATSQRD